MCLPCTEAQKLHLWINQLGVLSDERLTAPLGGDPIFERIDRVVLKTKSMEVTARIAGDESSPVMETFELPWAGKDEFAAAHIESIRNGKSDQKLLQSIARAHAWLGDLSDGRYSSIESLARAAKLHPNSGKHCG